MDTTTGDPATDSRDDRRQDPPNEQTGRTGTRQESTDPRSPASEPDADQPLDADEGDPNLNSHPG